MNPRSLTSRGESGSPHPHNAPSSTGPGGAASSPCASAPPAGQRLHGNRTQSTYRGACCRAGSLLGNPEERAREGVGSGRGKGASGRNAAPASSAEQSQLRGSVPFQFSPGRRRGDGEGGAGGAGGAQPGEWSGERRGVPGGPLPVTLHRNAEAWEEPGSGRRPGGRGSLDEREGGRAPRGRTRRESVYFYNLRNHLCGAR